MTEAKVADGSIGRSKLKGDEQIAWALIDGITNGILAQSGEVASGVCGAPGPVVAEVLFCNTTNAADNNTSTARIETSDSAGAATARRFYVAVLGK